MVYSSMHFANRSPTGNDGKSISKKTSFLTCFLSSFAAAFGPSTLAAVPQGWYVKTRGFPIDELPPDLLLLLLLPIVVASLSSIAVVRSGIRQFAARVLAGVVGWLAGGVIVGGLVILAGYVAWDVMDSLVFGSLGDAGLRIYVALAGASLAHLLFLLLSQTRKPAVNARTRLAVEIPLLLVGAFLASLVLFEPYHWLFRPDDQGIGGFLALTQASASPTVAVSFVTALQARRSDQAMDR